MNTPSPLIPQGATPPREKSSLYFKVLMILTVHVVVIGGMLLQGCKDTSTKDTAKQDNSAATPGSDATTVASTTPNTMPAPATGATTDIPTTLNPNISNVYAASTPSAAPMTQPPLPMPSVVPPAKSTDLAPEGESKEYVIVPRDTMSAIAHKNGISLKALTEANPNVNPKKLQVGQKLQIPAGTAAMAATSAPGTTPAATADPASTDGAVYLVKSGDTLSKIAKSHGTTFKKIMAMNDLKTTSIRAGQKLKLPAGKASTADSVAAPASAAVTPAVTPAARITATVPGTTSPVAAN